MRGLAKVNTPGETVTSNQEFKYAGFWNRFVALIIDMVVVSFIVFPFAVVIGIFAPKSFLVQVPFNLFTTTETLSKQPAQVVTHSDGSTSIVEEAIERDRVMGMWINYYRVKLTKTDGNIKKSRILIDRNTHMAIKETTSGDIEFYVIFIYWILLESSSWQASIGKRVMGLKVVTLDGSRPDLFQSAARNLLKIVSAITLFIGFMMAGWTARKQALHDMAARMLVIKEGASQKEGLSQHGM